MVHFLVATLEEKEGAAFGHGGRRLLVVAAELTDMANEESWWGLWWGVCGVDTLFSWLLVAVAGRRPMISGKVFPVWIAERACSMLRQWSNVCWKCSNSIVRAVLRVAVVSLKVRPVLSTILVPSWGDLITFVPGRENPKRFSLQASPRNRYH